ncbi:MAG: PAS domain S-box protein, partial [Candidatus Brocadiaceae bacterium]
MQILIVDDNDDDRLLLQRLIEKHGHHCIEAHDGLDALEIARTRKPNLIISDISMPRMDGFQLLRTAKQDNALKSIPFIFYSAIYAGNREKELAASLGAVSFIEKCHDVHDVWNALKGFLEAGTSPSAPEGEKCLVEEDVEFLKRYNAIVVSKLEEKVRELEKESLKSKQTADLLRESEQKYRTLCKQIDEQLKLTNDDLRVRNNELRISEETLKSLQTILNSMGDGLVVADTSGKFLFINPVAEEILGPGMKEVTAYTWSDYYAFYQPDMKTPYRADELPLSKAIRGESVTMADVFVKHVKEQKYSWASVTARPLLDEHGVLKGGVAIFRDITERKQYAQIIQKQREELQTILDSCPALIFFKDTENNIIRVNKATADLFGVPKEKIEGHSTFEINPREAEKSWRDDKEIIASGMAKTNIVYTADTPKGIRSFLTDKVPVKDEQGNTIGILGFSIDITKRRQAEERLAEREIQFRTIMETANDAIICLKEP